ncbi:heparinase II/III family protein [Desulfobacula toluolica]|uniref:Conserved uncharacterized protein, related to heparinase II/III n=1 Tax=Desulfobacula toluolica (strain DSM 7467 / Tol2) TaxID=651182 RepID=K0NGU4_DESTT|nr:heparinase II/III family protein [Desulfobacula toluolica]CCK80466.1 conserved uncharacterized protein, related to heparinase II/III [Desulfobacula toluolica Tol2]
MVNLKKTKSFLFILMSCIILFVYPRLADPGNLNADSKETTYSPYTIMKEHPRLFITRQKIPKIRKRCGDKRGVQSKYYTAIKKYADKYTPGKKKPSSFDCMILAFAHIIGEIPGFDYSKRSIAEYGRLGADLLLKLHPPKDLSYFQRYSPRFISCYDWLYSAMAKEERAVVINHFISACDEKKDLLKKSMGNRWRGAREVFAYYGLAFYNDGADIFTNDKLQAERIDKKANSYVDFFASWHLGQHVVTLETACKGGATPDGTMYGKAPYPGRLWPLAAWETASKNCLFDRTTYITGYPLFWLYNMLPYRTHVRYDNANGRIDRPGGLVRYGDYRYVGYSPVASRGTNTITALVQGVSVRQGKNDLAAVYNWQIQQQGGLEVTAFGGPVSTRRWISPGPNLVWDLIFRDGLVAAKSPKEAKLPLSFCSGSPNSGPTMLPDFPDGRPEGAGVVTIRSAWEDPDATLVWFKASSHMLSHSHRDQGSFQIYKKGWLAIDSGQYEETPHRGNYTLRSVAHNSLLVYRPGENLDKEKTDPVWYGYSNDGGQRWGRFVKSAEMVKDKDHFLGGIANFESMPGEYDYVHADITRAYNCTYVTSENHRPKVSRVTRTIIFLRPEEYVVIFDRVNSEKSEYPKRWLLHSIYRPEPDGREIFDGIVPYSKKIPGKRRGIELTGDLLGGISESRDTKLVTIRGWNFGPSDGRLVVRTLLPEKRIVRVVGGVDPYGTRQSNLSRPYQKGGLLFIENTEGFNSGDFVYLEPTSDPYSKSTHGRPHWQVDDIFYRGWGKIKKVDHAKKSLMMVPYRYGIPELPEGAVVIRSNHANANSFEFMDAEYNQWQMHGESVANAGPYHMQHGSWRMEVEPLEKKNADVFLTVLRPCDKETVGGTKVALMENIEYNDGDNFISLNIKGASKEYTLTFDRQSQNAHLKVLQNGEIKTDKALKGRAGR